MDKKQKMSGEGHGGIGGSSRRDGPSYFLTLYLNLKNLKKLTLIILKLKDIKRITQRCAWRFLKNKKQAHKIHGRNQEITQPREENNQMETKRAIHKINQTKRWFFQSTPLSNMTKTKKHPPHTYMKVYTHYKEIKEGKTETNKIRVQK